MKSNKKIFTSISWRQNPIHIQEALDEFDGEYDEEELRLMRIKFINEVAN
jgi:hypothetical protein